MSKLALIAVIILAVVVICLFIELSYKKSHAAVIVIAPEKITIIRGKELGEKSNIIIYNSGTCTDVEALEKVAKTKRNKYKMMTIHKHMAKKITKPFNEGYKEMKEGVAEATPVSFIYKTAVGIVDVAHEITTTGNTETPYKMLIPKDSKHMAFFDDGNIYIK